MCVGWFRVVFHRVLEEIGGFSLEIVNLQLNEQE